jgi:hypothetical protein
MILLCIFSLITILSDTPDSLVIKYSAEYRKNQVGDKVQYILKDGDFFPKEKGFPELASVKRRILTPVKGKIDWKYDVLRTGIEKGIPTVLRHYGEETPRETPEIYNPPPVTITENRPSPHGNATILINPFSFDGNVVKIRSPILIKIYFRGGNWIKPRGHEEKNSLIFLNEPRGEKIRTSAISTLRQAAFMYAKLKTTNDGLYEVTPGDLQAIGINPSSIDPQEIEVLGGYDRVMRWQLDSLEAMDTLPGVLPAIYEDDGDGIFEEGERIIFYAHSLSGWNRNSFSSNIEFYYHPYTDTNVYWLRFGGENPLQMEQISQSGGENVIHFTHTLHLEEDVYSPLKSGLVWGWKELNTTSGSTQNSISTTFNAPDVYSSEAIIRVAFYPKTAGTYYINISLNGQSSSRGILYQGNPMTDRTVFTDTIDALNSGSNNLIITSQTSEESIIMDYIEVIYERELIANENKLLITQNQSSIKNYTVEGFSSNPYILNISDSRKPSLILHSFSNGNTNFSAYSGRILLQSFPYPLEGISLADPTSLLAGGADWIAITTEEFISPSSRLELWRENHLRGISSPITQVVKIEEIYDNFSYGVKDPSAIKRFLNWTQTNWNPPVSYVLLFGDGSYDDKNLTGIGITSFIPIHTEGTYIYQDPGPLTVNPSWDNWFVDFNEDECPDIPIGRVTVSNTSEGDEWIDKLTGYEGNVEGWRMRAILLADDAFSPDYQSQDYQHTQNMEQISDFLPGWLYRDKVYLMGYPRISRKKPDARNAYLESMSEGALVGLYIGHGNLRQLAHEEVFNIQDIDLLSNGTKTPFYYFGACNVGYFERPDEDCIGGYSTLSKDGGNIVSIAAGRTTNYSENSLLGKSIVANLFSNSVRTAGDVFLMAMQGGGDKTYTFFGDPATAILIDSVPLDVVIPDTARGELQLEIRGTVSNSAEKVFCLLTEATFDTVLDAEEGRNPDYNGLPSPITITKEGNTIFRGSAPVIDDSFVLKVNIPYNVEARSGKISLYSRGEKESYSFSSIYFIKGSPPEDSTPPSVKFKIDNIFIARGNLIPFSGKMTLVITDSSGLDLRSANNLRIIINNREDIFLGNRFSYETGSSTKGEVTFTYNSNGSSDSINFEVYAKDNVGNIAIVEAAFRIKEQVLLWNVDNYPNPMKDKTVIVYHLSEEVPVEIKIFTIAGRLVKEIQSGISRDGANYVEWDGRDKLGRKVSNGVYYYMVKAGDGDPYYGKIAVIR